MEHRVGLGYDIHRLTEGRLLVLGGVEIPYIKGLLGHSDGDALLHAVCDALLGAISEGDIGEHFPDTDPKYHGVASAELLKIVLEKVKNKGCRITNIDTVIVAQEPNLSAFKKQIKENIARILGIDTENVGVKAKTNEGLGPVGQKEAICAYALACVSKED